MTCLCRPLIVQLVVVMYRAVAMSADFGLWVNCSRREVQEEGRRDAAFKRSIIQSFFRVALFVYY